MQPFTLWKLVSYFLKLGITGFGGPIALIGYMQSDLVEKNKWFSRENYLNGVALAQLVPGPVATQLAIYFGYLKAGIVGATLIGIAFVLPSFCIVVIFSHFYVRYQGFPWMAGVFYGMSAVVISVILCTAIRLVKITVGKKASLWAIFIFLTLITAFTQKVHILFFLGSGILALLFHLFPSRKEGRISRLFLFPPIELFLFFAKAAVVVYGSGMAIIPFIYGDVVGRYGWLTNAEFLDAVAIGVITPGPVLVSVGFIGYLVDRLQGAIASVVGIFLPVYLFVIIFAPFFHRIIRNNHVKVFVDGMTAAAVGAITGAIWILGKNAIMDTPTALMALVGLILIIKTKIPIPLIVIAGGFLGLGIKLVF